MLRNRWLWAGVCVAMGVLQAWDSGTLRAPAGIQALVALAIAIPVLTIVMTASYPWHALSVGAAFVVLTVARIISPISLPTLHIVAFIPAVIIFFSHVTQGERVKG